MLESEIRLSAERGFLFESEFVDVSLGGGCMFDIGAKKLSRLDRFFQAEDGIRDAQESRGLGDVYKRQF